MDKKIIEYRGARGLVAAEVLIDTKDNYSTGEVFDIAGLAEISKQTESASDTHYYDNQAAIIIVSTGADTINLQVSAIPYDVLAKLTGQTYEASKGLFIERERDVRYFALGYITEDTDGNERFIWRQKGSFSIPTETSGTKNAGTDANGQELVYTGINTQKTYLVDGKQRTIKAVNVNTGVNPVDEAAFFGEVQTPDSINAPVITPSVTINPSRISVEAGSKVTVAAETVPGGQAVTWTSSDDEVATVANGEITGVAAGTATITATITYEGTPQTDTCEVIVTAPEA